ncbi:MAG: sporulation transcriptional regulator SpoIIID [Ruminococcus sp.]|nr:sporulation transcriptional regulator SpoIIID [Ruminococcus sp.]
MKEQPKVRAVILGEYIVRQKATVRAAAEWFGVSKSTVHNDVSERLERIQPELYTQVKKILEQNKQERHIRGGLATKRKYALKRKQEEEYREKIRISR